MARSNFLFNLGGKSSVFISDGSSASEKLPLGSLTKSFTAVLVLKLVEMKKLGLEDRLSKYRLNIPGDESITIQQMLNHTSGLPEYFYSVDPADPSSDQKVLAMIRSAARKNPHPRGAFFYANTNFWLLGKICEEVSGESYAALYKKYVDQPLGIQCVSPRLSYFDLNWYGGAGCLAGSLSDLAGFADALSSRSEKLLRSATWSELAAHSAAMTKESKQSYGDGVIVTDLSVFPVLTHGGTIPGNKGVGASSALYISRRGGLAPMSLVAFKRSVWTPQVLNALYGTFASECAVADTKMWISLLCMKGAAKNIPSYVKAGFIDPKFASAMSPTQVDQFRSHIGTFTSFVVAGEVVKGDSVQLEGWAKRSNGSVRVIANYGPGGILTLLGLP